MTPNPDGPVHRCQALVDRLVHRCQALVDRNRVVRRILVAIVALVAVGGAIPQGGVDAHSGLDLASPGPGAVVGGEITEIQLFYSNLITGIDGSVTTPSGVVLDTEFRVDSQIQATIELSAPLAEPGEYAVRHNTLSVDGDRVEGAYLFTYDPAAPAPELIDAGGGSGISWIVWVVGGVGMVIIALLAWRLLASVRRARGLRPSARS